ncbi:MAG: hypothetical protein U0J38_04235 [Bacteroidales bacterium]|nr:hypothetical protein [Bacteroidales bacterium]
MSTKLYGTEKVGETFEYNGKTYKVMENRRSENVCLGCVFYEGRVSGCYEMACNPFLRDGKSSVYYEEVK